MPRWEANGVFFYPIRLYRTPQNLLFKTAPFWKFQNNGQELNVIFDVFGRCGKHYWLESLYLWYSFLQYKKTLHMAIKINCIPSGTFPHFLEHEKEETLSVYLETVKWALLEEWICPKKCWNYNNINRKNVIYNKIMSVKMLFSNGNMPWKVLR